MENNVYPENVKYLTELHEYNLAQLRKEIKKYLKAGQLIEDYVLGHMNGLLECLRGANVTIRWLMLHRHTKNKEHQKIVLGKHKLEDILALMLNTSKFETQLKDLLERLYVQKNQIWSKDKAECIERMVEIAE